MQEILTIPQAARYCSVNRMSMWRWVKAGYIPVSITPGGHHRIHVDDLSAFLREQGMYPLARKHFPRKNILIVDDDRQVRQVLTRTLTGQGFETESAADGFEAGFKVMQFKPDLLILDLIMPGIDGFEVCRSVRENTATAHIKILAYTGYSTVENRERILKAGADAFFVKPAERSTLLESIKKLLNIPVEQRQKPTRPVSIAQVRQI